jgi:hypothetical protein
MKIVSLIVQVTVVFGPLNVWVLRFRQPTPCRGGKARSMPKEFAAYGLSAWSSWAIGMHLNVRDPLVKALPASVILGLAEVLLASAFREPGCS